MSDRIHFPSDTRLTTEMLNSSFDYLELADQRFLSDLGIAGIIAGLGVTLSDDGQAVCVSPGIAYDRLGRRIKVETSHTLNLTDESQSRIATSEASESWVSVLVKFARREADPILDRWGRTVAQRLFESYAFVVRPHVDAAKGPSRAPPGENEVLICDVRRHSGQRGITQDNLDFSRRAYPVVWQAARIGTEKSTWQAVKPAVTVQEALDNVDAAISEHRAADKVLVDADPRRWNVVAAAATAQEALDHVDQAIHERSTAAGIPVDSAGWQVIKGCGNTQEAISYLDAQAERQMAFQWSAQDKLAQVDVKLEHLTTSPRDFSGRLHAVVIFETFVALRAIVPGEPLVRSLTVRGIRKGDIVLSTVATDTTPEAHLAFEAIEVHADNFLHCRVSTPSNLTTPETKVTLRVVAAVAAPPNSQNGQDIKRVVP